MDQEHPWQKCNLQLSRVFFKKKLNLYTISRNQSIWGLNWGPSDPFSTAERQVYKSGSKLTYIQATINEQG